MFRPHLLFIVPGFIYNLLSVSCVYLTGAKQVATGRGACEATYLMCADNLPDLVSIAHWGYIMAFILDRNERVKKLTC
jgi:hypothetical protein